MLYFKRVAQPRPRGARCGSDVPEVLAWSCRLGPADVPAVRGRTCASFLLLRVAQPRPRGARCGSGVPEVLALVLQARHCGRSCSAGTHLRYPVPMFPQVTP